MKGISFKLECPYFCCFRKPASTSTMTTYPVVPFTTLRGMLSNAMGLQRNDYTLQDKIAMGIAPASSPSNFTELAKILKLKSGESRNLPRSYPSSPVYKEMLFDVSIMIYIGIEDNEYDELLWRAIHDPARPLYIGQSDDMAMISETEHYDDIPTVTTTELNSIALGIHQACELIRLPYRFKDTNILEYTPVLSIPKQDKPVSFQAPTQCYSFGDNRVHLI